MGGFSFGVLVGFSFLVVLFVSAIKFSIASLKFSPISGMLVTDSGK